MMPWHSMVGSEDDCECAIGNNGATRDVVFERSIAQGVNTRVAIQVGLSRKSYWRLSKTLATNHGLNNAYFKTIGLISMRTLWCDIHHPATAR